MPRVQVPKIQLRPDARPRLWNASERIQISKVVPGAATAKNWQKLASSDVVEFIQRAELTDTERKECLRYPAAYFSKPNNVPTHLRKQIYFPDFVVTLMRTPHLPPKYAAFDVPLWFNKLDMKSYLKEVYNVDVIHIRSVVLQGKLKRHRSTSKYTQGAAFRPVSKKKMTVELLKPFIWPDEVEDLSPWEKQDYWRISKAQLDQNQKDIDWQRINPNEKHRKSIAEQAKALLSGKEKWSPTWESLPSDARVLRGRNHQPPSNP